MKILEIRTKVKKQAKTIIYSSIILSILVIIAGIFLLTFKEHIINYIEYFFTSIFHSDCIVKFIPILEI